MILRGVDKETMLKELVLLFILSGQYSQALDELELYLPSFPYQDNPVLHIYAGLLCLHLAQKPDGDFTEISPMFVPFTSLRLSGIRQLLSTRCTITPQSSKVYRSG